MTQIQSNAHRVEIVAASGLPSWFQAQTTKTWLALNTRLSDVNPCPGNGCSYSITEGQNAVIDDWCGAAASPTSLIIAAQGGHNGYAGNEVYVLNVNSETPAWVREVNPSTSVQAGVGYYADGKPSSRHGYSHSTYIPSNVVAGGRWFAPYAGATYSPSGNSNSLQAASYRPGSGAYDPINTYPNFPTAEGLPESVVAFDSGLNYVWIKMSGNALVGGLYAFDPVQKLYSAQLGSWAHTQGNMCGAIDATKRCFTVYDGSQLWTFDLANPTADRVVITPTGSGSGGNAPGFVFDPVGGKYLAWNGGATVRMLTPGPTPANSGWAWSTLTNGGGSATPTAPTAAGTYGRFAYLSALHALVVVNAVNQSAYVYKLPTVGNYT